MPFSALDIVYGLLVPALVAGLVAVVLSRALPSAAQQGIAGVAFVVGFATGYWLLPLGPWVPQSHWHWLPFALGMMLPAAFLVSDGARSRVFWWIVLTLAAVAAAWVLVPTRNQLEPPRPALVTIVVLLTLLVTWAVERTFRQASSRSSVVSLVVIFAAAGVVLLLSGSLRFTQIAGCGLGALLGVTLAARYSRRAPPLGSLAPPASLFLVASLMIGQVNSFSHVPAYCYLLLAAAPIALALPGSARQSSRPWVRRVTAAAPMGLALLALAVAAGAELWPRS